MHLCIYIHRDLSAYAMHVYRYKYTCIGFWVTCIGFWVLGFLFGWDLVLGLMVLGHEPPTLGFQAPSFIDGF